MNKTTKKVFSIILMVIFIIINLLHIIWPVWLMIEDIKTGTMHGTGIELAVLYPMILQLCTIPFVLAEIIYYIVFCKVKYFHVGNFVSFMFYLFQVGLFYLLLLF